MTRDEALREAIAERRDMAEAMAQSGLPDAAMRESDTADRWQAALSNSREGALNDLARMGQEADRIAELEGALREIQECTDVELSAPNPESGPLYTVKRVNRYARRALMGGKE